MEMHGEPHGEESEAAADYYPIIIRSVEPVPDLEERLERIFAVLSCRRWKSRTRRDLQHALHGAPDQRLGRAAAGRGPEDRCVDSTTPRLARMTLL
jgi:hypothetical protein